MNARQLQLGVTLDENAVHLLVDLLAQALNRIQPRQPQAPSPEEKHAARIKACQNAIFAGQQPPTDRGLLLNSRETARLLGVSSRTIATMQANKRIPQPVRIGRSVRWSFDELKAWIAEGCPPQSD
ncbi:MAG: helix-turn-helix domain-containing protein [Thermoguttaceae bacterium]|jgi:excisionase family DNA binding protein